MEASSIPCGTKWLAALHVKVRSLSNLVGTNVRIDVLIFPSAESCKIAVERYRIQYSEGDAG